MEPSNHFVITCGVDLSEYTAEVLTHMLDEARGHGGADCHVVSVVAPSHRTVLHEPTPYELESRKQHAWYWLGERINTVFDELDVSPAQRARTWLHVRVGAAEDEIVGLAAEAGSDLIVVGRFGVSAAESKRKLFGRKRGSVADRVLDLAECPVLVVQGASYALDAEATKQCADCVAVRCTSRGETWFCPRHHGEAPLLATTVIVNEGRL